MLSHDHLRVASDREHEGEHGELRELFTDKGPCRRCRRPEVLVGSAKEERSNPFARPALCLDCACDVCRQCKGRNIEAGAICATCRSLNTTEACTRCKRRFPAESFDGQEAEFRTCHVCLDVPY